MPITGRGPEERSRGVMVDGGAATKGAVETEGAMSNPSSSDGMGGSLGKRLHQLETHPLTERVIMILIIVNAVVLGLETSGPIMASIGLLLDALDSIILAIFVLELAARIVVHRWAFFRDRWSLFDFAVVSMALIPA